ncbi:MAG: S8 family serine peptidase, partial [Candidatus Margulisiibacteriota bacterium]
RLFRPFASPTTEPRYDLYQKSNIELMKLNHVWSSSSGVGTRIAIIDTGINANHEEFCDGAAIVSGVIVSTQSMDVSACSAIDTPFDAVTEGTPGQGDFVGYGTVSGTDYEFADTYPNDEDGHGSHVAGIAGARVNDRGIAGTAYNSTIIPIRVMASYYGRINGELKVFSTGTLEWIIAGINYAVTNNADVINMSLGITNESVVNIGLLKTTIDNAVAKGVLVVAAAGNESIDFDENQVAPACIDSAMSVASVSYLGQVTSYSNFGETLDVAAVGGDTGSCIYSVGIGSSTAYYQSCGTSMAAPYVAGYAALIKSYYKNNKGQTLTPAEIRRLIQLTASNSSNRNETLGYGIIDAQEAFLYAGAITSTDSTDLFYSADLTNALACYPNPFYQTSASNTSCVFNLSKASSGKYSIYSRRGQRVYYGEQGYATGQSTFTWNGKDSMGQSLPNGVYQLVFSFSPNDGSSAITKKHLISLLR